MAKTKTKPKYKHRKSEPTLASEADKYLCYQNSVQDPDHEIDFFDQAFKEAYGRKPRTLREDFCGTFAVCCRFVDAGPKRSAVGVDLDGEPLEWGRAYNLSKLKASKQSRITLLKEDVRHVGEPRYDILAAQNFSFWIFKTRAHLLEYFRIAHANLADEGLMVMDMMGGGECYEEGLEDVRVIRKGKRGYRYIWEQQSFNPITHDAVFAISFRFKDGSELKRCFTYDWRFWSIAEVRELLAEAGFSQSHAYWEIEYDDGEESGQWSRAGDAPSDPSWVSYVVGMK